MIWNRIFVSTFRSVVIPVVLVTAVAAPLRGGDDRPAKPRAFELIVVGPGGKPVPGAAIEFRGDPPATRDRVRKGRFVRQGPFGTTVLADASGRVVIEFPRAPTRLEAFIETPGYGPYYAGWASETHSETIPDRFTAELETAWSVGGIVVDAEGQPIAGAEVHPWIEFRKRPGDNRPFFSGQHARTDNDGRWHIDTVPVSMAGVTVSINHSGHRPYQRLLTRREFGIPTGRLASARIVLERGLTISGRITDEAGKPIAGARVRTKFHNDIREARSDLEGQYRIEGCEPRATRVVASAVGRATDMKEVTVDPKMGPVDFRMKPGGTVRIRVVDQQGQPVPKTRIFFQWWRGRFEYFEFDHVGQYADDHGVWTWHEAPLDEFRADICPPEGMQLQAQPIVARTQEYVFHVSGPLVVSGGVVAAATKQPIKNFRVVVGSRFPTDRISWNRQEPYAATDGRYEIRLTRAEPVTLIRIEASGYQAAVSREIKPDEGTIVVDFALEPGRDIVAKVVTPRNAAAAGAQVALGIPGSHIEVKNGEINSSLTFCARTQTGEDGRFHFPAQDGNFQLVIVHPTGFAHLRSKADWSARIIHLEPWARVEGTYRIGKAPAANVPIELDVWSLSSYGQDEPNIHTQYGTVTGPDGRFAFDRVVPGRGRIGRSIRFIANQGATEVASSCHLATAFPAGNTVRPELGGSGRAVIGRLQPPAGSTDPVRWSFAWISLQTAGPQRDDAPSYTSTIDREGRFRVEDVLPGDYSMSVFFMEHDAGRIVGHRFQVPKGDGEPVDLGTLTLVRP